VVKGYRRSRGHGAYPAPPGKRQKEARFARAGSLGELRSANLTSGGSKIGEASGERRERQERGMCAVRTAKVTAWIQANDEQIISWWTTFQTFDEAVDALWEEDWVPRGEDCQKLMEVGSAVLSALARINVDTASAMPKL
jgi:hypothetical protein